MSLLEKYLQGATIHVYEEIANMGSDAFEKKNLIEVRAVLTETMNRVAYNLDVIYTALREINYCFNENPRYDFEHLLLKPRWGTRFRIKKLEKAVLPLGYVPLSVKMFLSIVGSCNFAWDYNVNPDIPWEGADPLQITPVTDLLGEAKELEPDEDGDPIGLPLSADYYHKDNISGGPAYSVELTTMPKIDSRFLNEEHDTTFVNYLRIAFKNCGFSRAYAVKDLPDFVEYCKKVKPLLKPI
jgi:hypothetical protein